MRSKSSRLKTPPLGFDGELMISSFVFGVMYGAMVSAVNVKPLASSVSTKTQRAPAEGRVFLAHADEPRQAALAA